MANFMNLNTGQYEKLLQFPAYVCLLAANTNEYLDDIEAHSILELTHVKTFCADPLLTDFFKDVEVCFEQNIVALDYKLPLGIRQREKAIKDELAKLEAILILLDEQYATAMHQCMKSFKEHVSQVHHNVLVDFLFPISIKGLSY